MKPDMDLIRQIALQIEREDDGHAPHPMMIDGYTDVQIGYHLLLMVEGLAVGVETTTLSSPPSAIASRLTWAGHEFIDASREPSRWERSKALLGKAGGASFPVVMETLTKLAMGQIGE